MDNFLLQQQANVQIDRRKQREQESRISELEMQLTKQGVQNDLLQRMEDDLRK